MDDEKGMKEKEMKRKEKDQMRKRRREQTRYKRLLFPSSSLLQCSEEQ
jgi:hypothetical protein